MSSKATNSAAVRSRRRRSARRACAGFTFVELIITMAIIVVLSAIAVPKLVDAIKAAKMARAVADVRTIGDAALGYYAEYSAAPNTLSDIGYDQQLDPWGHNYQYLGFTDTTSSAQKRTDRFGVPINRYFDVYTMGPDGQTATSLTAPQCQDDVIWADDGFYMGLASNY